MNNINEKEISNLLQEITNGISTGEIKLADCSTLKKMIKDYLHGFDYRINSSVNSLSNNADYYNQQLYDIANKQWHSINHTGSVYQQALKNAMAQEYSPKKVHIMTQSTINNNVSQAVGTSDKVIDQYFAFLSDNTQKNRKLAKRMTELEKRQDRADARQNQSNHQFWYGMAATIIITASIVYLFL